MSSSKQRPAPTGPGNHLGGRPRKACDECRSLKVRCSNERPSCKRCSRLRRPCTWTPAATAQRAPNPRNNVPSAVTVDSIAPKDVRGDLGIPAALLSKLVDGYFSEFFYAPLLLHPPTFRQALGNNSVKKHVILSVCAVASSFYVGSSQDTYLFNDGFSSEWADNAQSLVFADLASPQEENMVTLLNLTLFWYCQGQWQRSFLLGCNTFCIARILNFPDSISSNDTSLSAEMSRRRFWASYTMSRLSGMLNDWIVPFETLGKVPLPWGEDDFSRGRLSENLIMFTDSERDNSFFAEIIRIGGLWTKVHKFIQSTELEFGERLATIQAMDTELRKWRNSLPEVFTFTETKARNCDPSALSQVLLINVLFHQSLCVLHASIIPLFTFCRVSPGHGDAQTRSAQTAFDHAKHISSLLQKCATSHNKDQSGFIGYSAYCSSAIQLPFLWCQATDVAARVTTNIKTNSLVMSRVGKRWKLVAGLEKHLRSLRRYHEISGYSLQDEPCNIDSEELNRHSRSFDRTRTSLLGHNDIIWKYGQISECGEIVKLEVDDDGQHEPDRGLDLNMTGFPAYSDVAAEMLDDFLAPFCVPADLDAFMADSTPY
ncbi:transcription factor [Pochonia chlamydosporia 170]|uniref:Transcription factor n=1 Tax=Pochonia chlamydosporia 170 TaxID=1380566 RepID=A0A179G0M2_METCM|nr:transcription factor [Pochonia chlamydosporia 170]OAQ71000.1 transcription factor [Pochonia chlamydosporia 170]